MGKNDYEDEKKGEGRLHKDIIITMSEGRGSRIDGFDRPERVPLQHDIGTAEVGV